MNTLTLYSIDTKIIIFIVIFIGSTLIHNFTKINILEVFH